MKNLWLWHVRGVHQQAVIVDAFQPSLGEALLAGVALKSSASRRVARLVMAE